MKRDFTAEPGAGQLRFAGQAPDPAALNQLADRLQHMLKTRTPDWPAIEEVIRALRGAGRNRDARRAEFVAWYRQEIGQHTKAKLVRTWSNRTLTPPGTLYRWLREEGL